MLLARVQGTKNTTNTLVQNDTWNNNFLVRDSESLVSVRLLDWQWPNYSNGITDLATLLHTSTSAQTRRIHRDELLDEYVHIWNQTLEDLHEVECVQRLTKAKITEDYEASLPGMFSMLVILSTAFSNLDVAEGGKPGEPGAIMRRHITALTELVDGGVLQKQISML